jgi:hypothetical protein
MLDPTGILLLPTPIAQTALVFHLTGQVWVPQLLFPTVYLSYQPLLLLPITLTFMPVALPLQSPPPRWLAAGEASLTTSTVAHSIPFHKVLMRAGEPSLAYPGWFFITFFLYIYYWFLDIDAIFCIYIHNIFFFTKYRYLLTKRNIEITIPACDYWPLLYKYNNRTGKK